MKFAVEETDNLQFSVIVELLTIPSMSKLSDLRKQQKKKQNASYCILHKK